MISNLFSSTSRTEENTIAMDKPNGAPSNTLRLRGDTGGKESNWKQVKTNVIAGSEGTFFVVKDGSSELQRIQLEATTNVFETVIGESTFEVVSSTNILHFSADTRLAATAWVQYLRSIVSSIDALSTSAIYKECHKRYGTNGIYDVIIPDNLSLGVVLERSSEWAIIKEVIRHDRGFHVGSAIVAINGNSSLNFFLLLIYSLYNTE